MLTTSDEDKGRASVDDTSRRIEDGITAIADRLINTPVLARGGGGRERSVCSTSTIASSGIAIR